MQNQKIEVPSKKLTATERQWLMISILTQLANVELVDFGIGNAKTNDFMQAGLMMLNLCDQAIEAALEKCRGMNVKGECIYVRPARYIPASIIFIDDLPTAKAIECAGDYNHLLVETSPSKTHLWIQSDKMLSEEERKIVQTVLQQRWGSDDGSTSGDHFGRLAGVRNHKRNGCWVNVKQYRTEGKPMSVADLLAEGAGVASPLPSGGGGLASVEDEHESESGKSHESHKEFKYACMSLDHGMVEEKIINNIAKRALMRGKRRTESAARRYAELTVKQAKLRRTA